ncbi:DUF202 domain-containing protein [Comamonas thiooxydans]|uniref:YidH family protein n=1 Tax=Comamonas thiooxydans TaxID=363952 RepID=UPI000B34CA3F|nr:DUF202 domain-containing protein [Comamonas thiooxydans]BDR09310.1 DUF202 domain-containing protein [Comamonas thiooxydans]
MALTNWHRQGKDPDYRFTLANERTFLAWIRTSLTLLASGILLDQLGPAYPRGLILLTALMLVLGAAFCSVTAYFRWRTNEIAMRFNYPLPYTIVLPVIVMLFVAVSLMVGVLLLH